MNGTWTTESAGHDGPPPAPASRPADVTLDTGEVPSTDTPFRPRGEGSLTFEQHAACFAELAIRPAAADVIHARYGLADEAKRLAEFRYWAERRQRDPLLDTRWTICFEEHVRACAPR